MSDLERQQRDVDELVSGLCRLQNDGLLHGMLDGYRTGAENLVSQGWTRLGPGERVIGPADAALLNEVQCAYVRWEALKKKVKENRAGSAEVSADASELTSGVKSGSDEKRILAAFAAADRPLYFDEAAEAAAGHRVTTHAPETWDRWCTAFRSLYKRELIEGLPAPEGEVRRYQLTLAGRDLHELDGVDVPAVGTKDLQAKILAAFGSCTGPEHPSRHQAIAHAAGVTEIGAIGEPGYDAWIRAFTDLVEAGFIEAEPAVPGRVRRYTFTGAGVEALDTKVPSEKWSAW